MSLWIEWVPVLEQIITCLLLLNLPPSPVYIGKGKANFKCFIMCEFTAGKKVYIFGDETEI